MFLMPSQYEPCGLNQMYSLRYGTIPIVRRTGGLADSVQHFDPETRRGTGVVFNDYDVGGVTWGVDTALDWYAQQDAVAPAGAERDGAGFLLEDAGGRVRRAVRAACDSAQVEDALLLEGDGAQHARKTATPCPTAGSRPSRACGHRPAAAAARRRIRPSRSRRTPPSRAPARRTSRSDSPCANCSPRHFHLVGDAAHRQLAIVRIRHAHAHPQLLLQQIAAQHLHIHHLELRRLEVRHEDSQQPASSTHAAAAIARRVFMAQLRSYSWLRSR